jgi:transmembrane sensor
MTFEQERPKSGADWIAELGGGELTHAERVALTDWLRESPRHVRELLEVALLEDDLATLRLRKDQVEAWVREAREAPAVPLPSARPSGYSSALAHEAGPLAEVPTPRSQDAREPGSQDSGRDRAVPAQVHRGGRHRGLRAWALAASVVLVVAAAGGYLRWSDGRYTTGFGEQKIVTLADGSVVTLNTDTELKVDLAADRRALWLVRGEAFFRVAHDPSRPFEVAVQDATVKAIGTQFNVRIAPAATVVSVLEGVVEVRDREGSEKIPGGTRERGAVRLARGEQAQVVRSPLPRAGEALIVVEPERAAASRSAAWLKGRVEFEDTPLAEVLDEFRRYREIHVEIDESLRELKLTGSFDAQDPESALAYIATLPGITVERPAAQSFIVRRR